MARRAFCQLLRGSRLCSLSSLGVSLITRNTCKLPNTSLLCVRLRSSSASQSETDGEQRVLKKKELRFQKSELLRRNRLDPILEKRARNGSLLVPLSEVHEEWKEHCGRQHLQSIGLHSNIYKDISGFLFYPSLFMTIKYGERCSVERGNILTAEQASCEPNVKLPKQLREQREKFATLILSNPDGHLTHGSMELLHWMVVNIPCDRDVSEGTVVVPYLQPVPPRGSGFHRYVFSLYTHAHPFQETTPTGMGLAAEGDWLNQRTISTRHFLSTRQELEPCAFAFFQAQWDNSVHEVYMKSLAYSEPVYQLKKQRTPRQLKQREVRKQRAKKYRAM